jgi:hypothetical protein
VGTVNLRGEIQPENAVYHILGYQTKGKVINILSSGRSEQDCQVGFCAFLRELHHSQFYIPWILSSANVLP